MEKRCEDKKRLNQKSTIGHTKEDSESIRENYKRNG